MVLSSALYERALLGAILTSLRHGTPALARIILAELATLVFFFCSQSLRVRAPPLSTKQFPDQRLVSSP